MADKQKILKLIEQAAKEGRATLSLSNNQLTSLPPEITKLTKTLAHPTDVKAIFAALAGLVSGERLNEAKMLVVGDGKVGKSSVVERLLCWASRSTTR